MNRREAIRLMAATGAFGLVPERLMAAGKQRVNHGNLLPNKKFCVGHRGASAYAPENTLPSYALAIKQGADYVEQDLQVTKDKVLVCSHDQTLERVTNVAEVFPDRFKEVTARRKKVKRWYIHDFTLSELKQLDFGARFDPKFKGTQIPTWEEAIDLIKGKAGLCPETKSPEVYTKLGIDMEHLVAKAMARAGVVQARAGASTPVFIQSFSKESLKKLQTNFGIEWPMLWLGFQGAKPTPEKMKEAAAFAAAIGPAKADLTPELVNQAHDLGMAVVAYTFRKEDLNDYPNLSAEMSHYLYDVGIDGLFTNNPDLFPRKKV